MMAQGKNDFNRAFFMEVFLVAVWEIWKQRNNKIFRGIAPSIKSWFSNFRSGLTLQLYRMENVYSDLISSWLTSL
jgi:hypothetical protein